MTRTALLSAIILFMAAMPLLGQELGLTLDEALGIALRDNREVMLKASEVDKAKAKIAESNAALLPSLNFSGSWTDTRGSYSKDLAQTTAQATLKQYIYKGGKTVNTISQSKYKKEVAQALLDKSRLDLGFSVYKAFYTLLFSEELSLINKGLLNV